MPHRGDAAPHSHAARVVGAVHDYLVEAEPADTPPQVLQAANWLHVARKGGKFVRKDPHLPRPSISRMAHDLRGSLDFVSRTERARLHKCRHLLRRTVHRQFLRALGPLGRDDDPLFGEKVLTQFRHRNALQPYLSAPWGDSCSPSRRISISAQPRQKLSDLPLGNFVSDGQQGTSGSLVIKFQVLI